MSNNVLVCTILSTSNVLKELKLAADEITKEAATAALSIKTPQADKLLKLARELPDHYKKLKENIKVFQDKYFEDFGRDEVPRDDKVQQDRLDLITVLAKLTLTCLLACEVAARS